MVGFLIVLLIIDGLILIGAVLLQSGKGGGLAAVGGGAATDTFIGGRQAATLLTRTTWVTAGIFLFLALVLAVMSSRGTGGTDSLLQRELQQAAPVQPQPLDIPGSEGTEPAPVIPGTEGATQSTEGAAQPGEGAPAQP